ncbi:MAG: hypothetical protein HGA78_00355 [Nitrospirales bacterium]|nr:hypothetical protein [Nitrospirales bacterium]
MKSTSGIQWEILSSGDKAGADLKAAETADVLVVENNADALCLLREIRGSRDPKIYLKPLLLRKQGTEEVSEEAAELSDGVVGAETDLKAFLDEKSEPLRKMLNAQQELGPVAQEHRERHIAEKILRFLYVREEKTIRPVRSSRNSCAYIYPVIHANFDEPGLQDYELLDSLERNGYVTGSFVDRLHFCGFCSSAFLNFREICPRCSSANLRVEDVIHHYACAFAGAETDFRKGDSLICPKCKKELKHIGVDFEKPSLVFTCRDCGHVFQDTGVDALCIGCGKKSDPDNLITKDVKEYRLTNLGRSAALYGMNITGMEQLREYLKFVDPDTFRVLLTNEIARIGRYRKSDSSVGLISFRNLPEVYARLGSKSSGIGKEIAGIINSILRTSDVIGQLNESAFAILFIETPPEGAGIAMERVEGRLRTLIRDNLDMEAVVHTTFLSLDGKKAADEVMSWVSANV